MLACYESEQTDTTRQFFARTLPGFTASLAALRRCGDRASRCAAAGRLAPKARYLVRRCTTAPHGGAPDRVSVARAVRAAHARLNASDHVLERVQHAVLDGAHRGLVDGQHV